MIMRAPGTNNDGNSKNRRRTSGDRNVSHAICPNELFDGYVRAVAYKYYE